MKDHSFLDRLRFANVRRSEESFGHLIKDWNVLEWAGAMGGEAGEALNMAKKIRRGDYDLHEHVTIKGIRQTAAEHLADEVADMIIYADLLLARIGIDMEVAIAHKFDRTSYERGSSIRLVRA